MSGTDSTRVYRTYSEREIGRVLDGIIARVANLGEREALKHMKKIMDVGEERGFNMELYRGIYEELQGTQRKLAWPGEDHKGDAEFVSGRKSQPKSDI